MTLPAAAVSVVLPFRDASATLGEALDSIRNQSLHNIECVLVDHGSQDSSSSIASDFARRDSRFRVVRSDGTFVDALNRGVGASRAPLIARMDSDDRSRPLRLQRQLHTLEQDRGLQLVSCLVDCFPRAEIAGGMRRYQTWLNAQVSPTEIRNALFVESPLPHPSVVFRRETFDTVRGYAETGGPEDYDLWLRMILGGARAAKVPEVLLEWRESPTRMSRVDPRYAKDRFFATKLRHFPRAVPLGTPLQIWGTGPTARRWARELRRAGYPIRRFVDVVDKRVGRTVQGVTVEPPAAIEADAGLVLAAVGLTGARAIIEENLQARGMWPGRDYIAVA